MTILSELKSLANPVDRTVLTGFFKMGKGSYSEDDVFLGVKVPKIRALVKRRAAACSSSELEHLLASRYHEMRLTGLLILCHHFRAVAGNEARQLEIVDCYLAHPHDLIHKAVGWLLREVGKRDQPLLERYLATRLSRLPRTTLRYAIERLPDSLRQHYLSRRV